MRADERSWVSRGAHKLIGALDAFGISVDRPRCLDAGASTGGFTEVLLDRGAREVVAVDVGYGQFAWPLRSDTAGDGVGTHQRARADCRRHRRTGRSCGRRSVVHLAVDGAARADRRARRTTPISFPW